jgi:hypothetical protein
MPFFKKSQIKNNKKHVLKETNINTKITTWSNKKTNKKMTNVFFLKLKSLNSKLETKPQSQELNL